MFEGRRWRGVAFGEPRDVLHLEETSWSAPKDGWLLVKVLAAGVGLPELLMTRGQLPGLSRLPVSPGEEVCGAIVAVPVGSAFAVGDRVMGMTPFAEGWGGYGEYAYVREQQTMLVPGHFTDEEAAGFVVGFRTAYTGLVLRVPVSEGQVLLVLGAAGSSGVTAIQLGKALGATVIAVAGSERKLAYCAGIGADHGVNHRTADVAAEVSALTDGRGADVIYDTVGGELAARALAGIARFGRIAIVGLASGSFVRLDPLDMLVRNYSAAGVFAGGLTSEEDAAANRRLFELADRKAITTPVGNVYEFADVPEVLAGCESPPPGKSVIRVAGGSAG